MSSWCAGNGRDRVTWLGSFSTQQTQLCIRSLGSLASQASFASQISRYRNLPPSVIGDTSPSGSYILGTLLRIPHFVRSVLSDGKLMLMVLLSLFHCRQSREAPSFFEVPNYSFAYVSSSETGTEHAVSNSFTFVCHLCNSNVPLANISTDADLIISAFAWVGPPLMRSST